MSRSLVSIIVPVYNVELYLRDCLDSIIHQSYAHLEIIIVDDGSTDNSGLVCDEYSSLDTRIKVIHKTNGGLSSARNTGMNFATGRYIYFCDSDDYLDLNAIDKLVRTIEIERVEVVYFDARTVDAYGNDVPFQRYLLTKNYPTANAAEVIYKRLMRDEYKPCVWLYFYDREFVVKKNLKFYEGIIGEDELFSFNVFQSECRIATIQEALYYHRIREGSIMTTGTKLERRFKDYYIITKEMDRLLVDNNLIGQELIIRIIKSSMYAYKQLDSEEKKTWYNTYNEIKKMIKKNKGYGDSLLVVRAYSYHLALLLSGVRKYVRRVFCG